MPHVPFTDQEVFSTHAGSTRRKKACGAAALLLAGSLLGCSALERVDPRPSPRPAGGGRERPATVATGVQIALDAVFYPPGASPEVTLDLGRHDPGAATLVAFLATPRGGDVEPLTLSRVGAGLYRGAAPAILADSGTPTPTDGVLVVGEGEPFFAMYFPDKSRPALADLPVDVYSDIGLLDSAASPPRVEPSLALTADEGVSPRPAATIWRQGELPVQIARGEVIVWVRDDAHLTSFLEESGGRVLARQDLEAGESGAAYAQAVLVAVPPDPEAPRRLALLDRLLGETRPLVVSQASAAGLLAQVTAWRLDGWAVAVNPRLQSHSAPAISAAENAVLTPTMRLSPGCRPGDPARPCFLNVPALWAWNALWDRDQARIRVAVLDAGFATNGDFRAPASGPLRECDMTVPDRPLCGPGRAQGPATVASRWHGTGVVTVMGGVVNDGQGTAGVAGQILEPMLYKYDLVAYAFDIGAGIRLATDDGASCINISAGYPCNILTSVGPDFDLCTEAGRLGICGVVTASAASAAAAVCAATAWIPIAGAIACGAATGGVVASTAACLSTLAYGNLAGPIDAGVQYARLRGVPVVVSAGNLVTRDTLPEVIRDLVALDERTSDRWRVVPATLPHTISVGAVEGGSLANAHLFGDSVDVWAPVRSAHLAPSDPRDPRSAPVVTTIGATSGAAAYVSGVVAAMQAADRNLDPTTPGLSDSRRATIVQRVRDLLRANSFTNAQLAAAGFADQPVERPRLVNPLATVIAAAGSSVPDVAALGYDPSLGFGELDRPDDTPARATLLVAGEERTGTIVTLRGSGTLASPRDVDFYSFAMRPGSRPMTADVILSFPGGHGDLGIGGGGLRLVSRSGNEVLTYRAVAAAGSRVVFSVGAADGQDNVYKVRVTPPVPAVPTVRIVEPVEADEATVCAGEEVNLRAVSELPGHAVAVPAAAHRWFDGSGDLGSGNPLVRRFAVGLHEVTVEVYGDREARDVIRLAALSCRRSPPTGRIVTPAADSGSSDLEYVYDGFDEERGMWFKDLWLEAIVRDPEDGVLSGGRLVWRTQRTELQPAILGTGNRVRVRLYSNSCWGTEHLITLEATDGDGNRVSLGTRRVVIWTLC